MHRICDGVLDSHMATDRVQHTCIGVECHTLPDIPRNSERVHKLELGVRRRRHGTQLAAAVVHVQPTAYPPR